MYIYVYIYICLLIVGYTYLKHLKNLKPSLFASSMRI